MISGKLLESLVISGKLLERLVISGKFLESLVLSGKLLERHIALAGRKCFIFDCYFLARIIPFLRFSITL